VLAEAIEANLPYRRFRDPEARLFPGSSADALRTAIAKACKAEGIPTFSPHDLRHRRISLLHLSGVPWARIGGRRAAQPLGDGRHLHPRLERRDGSGLRGAAGSLRAMGQA
jgi:integrase